MDKTKTDDDKAVDAFILLVKNLVIAQKRLGVKGLGSQAEVDAAADRKLATQRYNEDCNKAATEGEKAFPDWKDAVSNLETLGGFDMETMNGILASDNPAKALYELGKNPENYHRIMELSPARRIIEIGKIAMAPVQAKKVSDAPPPVNPVGGRAAPVAATEITDKMDDDTAYAILKARRAKRFEQGARH